jgi:hypothetical protein
MNSNKNNRNHAKLSVFLHLLSKPLKMLRLLVSLILICTVQSARVNFKACAGGYNTPEWIESEWCSTEKCTVTRGQAFQGRVSMTPREDFSRLIVAAKASLLGIPFPIEIPPGYEDGCDWLEGGATCPIRANVNYIWNAMVPVDKSYPAASGVELQSM